MKGVDFDQYLDDYLKERNQKPNENAVLNKSTEIKNVSSILVDSASYLDDNLILPNNSPLQTDVIEYESKETDDYFGYSIFSNNPFLSKEYTLGNIDEGYLISPGDKLRILVFGYHSFETEVEVDLNGNIKIGNFGVFQAGGNTFKTLRDRLKIYLGKYFSNLLFESPNTFLDVSLTQIRPIKITVIGESNSPGAHLISGMASVLNALYSSGGIKKTGSLRQIKLIRNNKIIHEIDLYDFIIKGVFNEDIRLSNNDILFIPPRISKVELTGEVKFKGFFELLQGETIKELLHYSGGLLPSSSTKNISINRIKKLNDRKSGDNYDRFLTSINIDFEGNDILNDFLIYDGDKVFIPTILNKTLNQVSVFGNVNLEGYHSLSEYSNLYSLVMEAAKGLKPNTYLNKVDVFGETLDGLKNISTYSLKSIIEKKVEVELNDMDSVRVYNEVEVSGKKIIKISGFLDEPKVIFWRENFSIFDLIFQATNIEELNYRSEILSSRIDLKRFDIWNGSFSIETYSLDNLDILINTFLSPNDELILYSKSVTQNLRPNIQVRGYVKTPGKINLLNDMSVEDAILQANGFIEKADTSIVTVNREKYDYLNGTMSERFDVTLDYSYMMGLSNKSSNHFTLQPNDVVSVRKLDGAQNLSVISISGAVRYPGDYVLESKTDDFVSLINKSGGLAPDSYLNGSYFQRDGKVIAFNFKKLKSVGESFFKNGDVINISSKSGLVQLNGLVQNEGDFFWKEGKRAKYYIKRSGGKTKNIGTRSFVNNSNGISRKINIFHNPMVYPDAKIFVNENMKEKKESNNFVDGFIKVLTIVTGSLTTIILVNNMNNN